MIDALLARLPARFIFVVGKGGVGKSTTAGALALALADRNQTTHLISTDPAHSLFDLHNRHASKTRIADDRADGAPTISRCNERLTLEEFAARPYADHLFGEMRAALIQLIERGTYLDTNDAAAFLDLSIPGIDEVMSALRLVDIADTNAERVVVDTAPSGHTMRLLESASTIRSWTAAGRAMAEKAGVVAARLVGAEVPLAALPMLDRLDDRARRFREEVLGTGRALLVTRHGGVIAAETERNAHALQRHGLAVGAILSVFEDGDADFVVARVQDPRGCDGLREWQDHVGKATPQKPAPQPHSVAATHDHASEQWIARRSARFCLVAGKGGVGKSTCAAALAVALARSRRVCIVSTDPAGSLSEIFGMAVSAETVQISPNLFARQINAAAELEQMRTQYRQQVDDVFRRIGLDSALRLDRAVIDALFDFAPPGLDELISVTDMVEQSAAFDVMVIDTAPTGHFLRLIELPQIARDWVHALLRMLVKYGAVASLDALARDLLGFSKRLRQLQLDLSTAGTTAVFLVTLNQPVVTAETARLSAALARAGLPVAATILNRASGDEPRDARLVRAPEMGHDIVGAAALRAFASQWELPLE